MDDPQFHDTDTVTNASEDEEFDNTQLVQSGDHPYTRLGRPAPLPYNWRHPPRLPRDQLVRRNNTGLPPRQAPYAALPDMAVNQESGLFNVRDLDKQLEVFLKQHTTLNRVSHYYRAKIKKLRSLNANRTAIYNRNLDREAAIRRDGGDMSLLSRIRLNELAFDTKYYMEIKNATKKLADALASEEKNINSYVSWLDYKILDLYKRRFSCMIDLAKELDRVKTAPLPAVDEELPNDPFRCIKIAMKTSQECSICFEQRYGKDLIFMGRCMHAFCVLCYHNVKTNSNQDSNILNGNQLDRCPLCNCTDVTPIRFQATGDHYQLCVV